MAPSSEVQRILDALTPEVESELAVELTRRQRGRRGPCQRAQEALMSNLASLRLPALG